jgi:carbamoyltransferase
LADVIGQAAEDLAGQVATGALAAGGSFFANPRFNTELARVMRQGLAISAVPETSGRAIGAATGSAAGEAGPGLALGPAFSEEDIKRTLDNCRLAGVRPDWARRSRAPRSCWPGKVVAWFKGTRRRPRSRHAQHPRSVGGRAQNMNGTAAGAVDGRFRGVRGVRGRPLIRPAALARGVVDVEVHQDRRAALSGALDWRHRVRVHDVNAAHGLRFGELLEAHNAATGTPGLIEANLAGPGEPVACTPRDAVRTVYSSAIVVLVIGRFMLMKDYWLLRSQDA